MGDSKSTGQTPSPDAVTSGPQARTGSPHSARAAEPLDLMVGRRIAGRRLALGLSQTALAERVGVSCQQMQKYEGGLNRISASRLHALSLVLGLPVSAFFPDHADEPQPDRLSTLQALVATPESEAVVQGLARIQDRAVRKAITRLVEVLARAA